MDLQFVPFLGMGSLGYLVGPRPAWLPMWGFRLRGEEWIGMAERQASIERELFNKKKYVYIYIYGTPPQTHTFSEFTGICAILLLFTMFKCLFFFGVYFIFSKSCVES